VTTGFFVSFVRNFCSITDTSGSKE
jgi:hypothetical protein